MKYLTLFALLFSFSAFTAELELMCKYKGGGEEVFTLEVTNESLIWSEGNSQMEGTPTYFSRIHSKYGENRYTGKDGAMHFMIQQLSGNVWRFSIAMFHPDETLYLGANENLFCIER